MILRDDHLHLGDEALLRYRFKTLKAETSAKVGAHLGRCSRCATRFAEIERGLDSLQAYGAESELDEALAARVLRQLRHQREEQERKHPGHPPDEVQPARVIVRKDGFHVLEVAYGQQDEVVIRSAPPDEDSED